ncbi:MAG: hypothetical protein IMZ52_02300 [Actinobacteria bacterium]|nr:hypothetical protein [Actinomycetota bacterium]MBE3114854.1 hypothetical protein [Actinomycetota bacterium]
MLSVRHKELEEMIEEHYNNGKIPMYIWGAPGIGKCLEKGTTVLMYNGIIKLVEDINVGDELMGVDSTPRKVLTITSGKDKLYEVMPVKGESFSTNEHHILSLKRSYHWNRYHSIKKGGEILNISVKDYIKKSNHFKHQHKLYRVGVDFPFQKVILDPYFLGIWLGDGNSRTPSITTQDKEIVEFLTQFAESENLKVHVDVNKTDSKTNSYRITTGVMGKKTNRPLNTVLEKLRSLNLILNKHIPQEYKINSQEVRLQLLAGLIDTDGHLQCNCFIYTSVNEKLADDVLFLARSLGFAAYKKTGIARLKSRNYETEVFDITISGDIIRIPTKITRRKAHKRKQKKDVLVTGVNVKEKGIGEYFGFTLDKDGLFLLGDFTVTHNSDTVRKKAKDIAQKRGKIYVEWSKLSMDEKQDVLKSPQRYFFLKDERLSMCDPSDIKGIPDLRKVNGGDKVGDVKVVEWMVPIWVQLASLKGAEGIIFFDEINLAPQSVQSSSYQVINDRACGEVSLADGVMCVAAGNRLEDRANVYELSRPLRNRFTHVTLEAPGITDKCENDWGEWALANGIDFRIVTFLMQHPTHLNPKENVETDEMAFPTPRSWGKLCSPLIKGKEDIQSIERYTASAVGEYPAKEFASFLRLKRKVNLTDILSDPTKAKEIVEIDLKYSLITLVAEWYFSEREPVKTRKNAKPEVPMDKVLEIADNLTPDFSICMLRIIRGRNQDGFIKDVLASKHFDNFSKKYKKYFFNITDCGKSEKED